MKKSTDLLLKLTWLCKEKERITKSRREREREKEGTQAQKWKQRWCEVNRDAERTKREG